MCSSSTHTKRRHRDTDDVAPMDKLQGEKQPPEDKDIERDCPPLDEDEHPNEAVRDDEYCYEVAVQSCSSRSLVLNSEQKDSGCWLQLMCCAYLQLESSYFESMQRTEGSGKFQDQGSVPKVPKGPRPRFWGVGTSFGSSKNKDAGQ